MLGNGGGWARTVFYHSCIWHLGGYSHLGASVCAGECGGQIDPILQHSDQSANTQHCAGEGLALIGIHACKLGKTILCSLIGFTKTKQALRKS